MAHKNPGRSHCKQGQDTNSAERVIVMLDHIEKRVELLREHAASLEQEKEALLTMLNTIRNKEDISLMSEGEREDIAHTTERLLSRALSVDISVMTPRNEFQKAALMKVENWIDCLLTRVKEDPVAARIACESYLNACSTESSGPADQRFQHAVIECTADDQKKTRKRLQSILTAIMQVEREKT
ncbi:BAG family molecular chaperone regulator 2-like [Ornithodoros turicata]